MTQPAVVRVVVDLHGSTAVGAIVAGSRRALDEDPHLAVVLVGDTTAAQAALVGATPTAGERLTLVRAAPLDGEPGNGARAVRKQRDASVRVATQLVRDGLADACVLTGPVGVGLAAAQFSLHQLPGVTQPGVGAQIGGPSAATSFVLVDVDGRGELDPVVMAQSALLGSCFARAQLGVDRPPVAMLIADHPIDAYGAARRRALTLLETYAAAGLIQWAGTVRVGEIVASAAESDDPEGRGGLEGQARVVVTDGFSGSVLRDTLLAGCLPPSGHPQGRAVRAGGVVLGLEGVVVLAPGTRTASSTDRSVETVADAIADAARAHRGALVEHCTASLADLIAWRRLAVGLNPVAP